MKKQAHLGVKNHPSGNPDCWDENVKYASVWDCKIQPLAKLIGGSINTLSRIKLYMQQRTFSHFFWGRGGELTLDDPYQNCVKGRQSSWKDIAMKACKRRERKLEIWELAPEKMFVAMPFRKSENARLHSQI